MSRFVHLTDWLLVSYSDLVEVGEEERMQTFFSLLLFLLLFSLGLVAVSEEEKLRTWVDFVVWLLDSFTWWELLTFVI